MSIYLLPPTSRVEARRQARAVKRRHVTARARRREHGAAEPTGAKLAYMKGLGKLLGDVWAEIVRNADLPRQDARADRFHVQILDKVERDAPSLIGDIGRRVSEHNGRQMRRIVGIDPRVDPGTGPVIDGFRQENLRLITNLTQDMFDRIDEIVTERLAGRVEDLSKELQKGLDFTKARANLIARDQTLKLNGQLTRVRQQNAGVSEYIWTTSGDEKVREEHAALEGTRQRWDNPPAPGHPGEDYQCRCTPYPVIPGIEDETEGD